MIGYYVQRLLNQPRSKLSLEDLIPLKLLGYSTEQLLETIVDRGYLLHGSHEQLDRLAADENGALYAANNPAIAIIRGIVSNANGPGITYPLFIGDNNDLLVRIHNIRHDTIKSTGYTYIIGKDGFRNEPAGSWQYVKHAPAEIIASVEVDIFDFPYPLIDAETDKRIN
jgi:hypothetical protein